MKKFMSLFLAIVLIFTCIPSNVFAADVANATIYVESTYAVAGATVEVNVSITDNPGIAGATFTLAYHEDLTLVNAVKGTAFSALDYTQPGTFSNPCNFTWDSENAEATEDGVILTLTFQVSETAEQNEELNVDFSYRYGDVFDNNDNDLTISFTNGNIVVLDYVPGDLFEDGIINSKDTRLIRQYIAGGYDITINEKAADVNDDGVINTKDTRLIRRYIAGGYGVVLLPSTPKCNHTMEATAAKDATCTVAGNIPYWYCTTCEKYFSDENGSTEVALADTVVAATGHTEVIIPDVAPTYDAAGSTGGVKCSVCNTVIVEPTPVAPLEKDEYFVVYDLAGTDDYLKEYLATVDVSEINTNPSLFDTTEQGYTLNPIAIDAIPGYEFQGWQDGYGEAVKTIEKGTTGSITLIAKWKKTEYDIIFDSPLFPLETKTRTIDETYYLPDNLEWDHYVFMGWSDASGKIIKQITPGTKDITVHANWTSNRSQAKANDYLADGPIIIEDKEAQKYYFVYDLGMIVNVPLETIVDLGYRSSLGIEETVIKTITLEETEATTLNTAVENATTKSSSWTLSKDWNELLTDITGGEEAVTSSQTIALSSGSSAAYNSSGSTYVGESFHASKDNLTTSKTITDDSWKVGAEAGVEAGYGPVKASVSVSGEVAHSENQEDYSEQKTNMTLDSTWNTTNSYSNSGSFTSSQSVTDSVMKAAKDTWQHEISKSIGGSDSETTSDSVSNKESTGYSSSMSFHSIEETQTIEKISSDASTTPGYYRYVLAGDFYVYAIVSYDVATGTYSVTNHSVLADETRKLLDYSKNDPLYQDYNNAVLPFEVPIDVHNYIFDALAATDGLIIDRETGMVTDYEGDAKNVFVPDYAIFDNGDGSAATVVKVTGFAASAFAGKDIETIKLGRYITEIPAGAFENCTSLKSVKYNALTSIGEKAFNGCNSLVTFTVDDSVTSLGTNAFDNVLSLTVNARSAAVVTAAVTSSAQSLTLNLDSLTNVLGDVELDVKATESFTLNGYGETYSNLSVKSSATTTVINRMTFADNEQTPLHLNSANITLNQVKVENAAGLVLVSEADNTVLTLQGKNAFSTNGETVMLCRGMIIVRKDGVTETTELNVNDKTVLVCGSVIDEKGYLKVVNDDQIKIITEEEYANMLNSHYIFFDANGGQVDTAAMTVFYGSAFGTLPTPTLDYHTFDGWFTANGTKVTADTIMTEANDITLTAHWTQNAPSGWVKASDMPSDAQVINTEWRYTLREYTSSASSSLSGWTHYDTARTGWTDWSGWATWNPDNGVRDVEWHSAYDHTEYHYYRWISGYYVYSYQKSSSYTFEEKWFTYELTQKPGYSYVYYDGKNNGYNDWIRADYDGNRDTDKTYTRDIYRDEWRYRDPIYTYYFYRDLSKTATSDPTGQSNVSNVVKWVQYRPK